MERRLFNHNYFTLLDLYNISVFFILRSRIIHILFFLFWLFFSLLAQSKISGSITRSKSVINFFFPFIVNASEHLQISRVDWNIHVVEERRKIREKRVEKGGYCILPFKYLTRLHFSCFLFFYGLVYQKSLILYSEITHHLSRLRDWSRLLSRLISHPVHHFSCKKQKVKRNYSARCI